MRSPIVALFVWLAASIVPIAPILAQTASSETTPTIAELENAPNRVIFPALGTRAPYPGPASTTRVGEGTLPERLALVIGIDRYDSETINIPNLNNAEKDAAAVSEELRLAGFKQSLILSSKVNNGLLTKTRFLNSVSTFVSRLAQTSIDRAGRPPVILVYFAGHGISYEDKDYLLPADFSPQFAEDIPAMAVSIDEIKSRLDWAKSALVIFVSDACRNPLSISLAQREKGNQKANIIVGGYAAGKLMEAGNGVAPVSGRGDFIISYSTLMGGKALDDDGTGQMGPFAARFIEVLQKSRADAIANVTGEPQDNIGSILADVGQTLRLKYGQSLEARYVSSRFQLYPTAQSYLNQLILWRVTNRRIKKHIASSDTNENIERESNKAVYCEYLSYLSTVSYYEYYGDVALRGVERYKDSGFQCGFAQAIFPVRGTRAQTPWGFPATSYASFRDWRSELAQNGGPQNTTSTLTVAAALSRSSLSDSAKAELRLLRPSATIGSVRSIAIRTDILAESSLRGAPIGRANDGELVELLMEEVPGSENGVPRIRLRETVGYIDRRAISSGRIALAYGARINGDDVVYDRDGLRQLTASGIISDVVIQYRSSLGSKGLLAAGRVSEEASDLVGPSSEAGIVFPKLSAIDDASSVDVMGNSDVRLVLTVLLLDRTVRTRLAAVSGKAIDAAAALNVEDAAALTFNTTGLRIPGLGIEALKNVETGATSTRVARSTPQCLAALNAASEALKKTPAAVFVQYPGWAWRPRSESVRQLLRGVGFSTPDGDDEPGPQTDEIRVCADYPVAPAEAAAAVLQACSGAAFQVKRIPACRKRSARGNRIEIWLGSTAAVQTALTPVLPSYFGGPERRIASDLLIQRYPGSSNEVVSAVVSAIKPSGPDSYRYNIYVARTLAGISGGWSGSEDQIQSLRTLKDSANYASDATFRRNVDEALSNFRKKPE